MIYHEFLGKRQTYVRRAAWERISPTIRKLDRECITQMSVQIMSSGHQLEGSIPPTLPGQMNMAISEHVTRIDLKRM